MQFLAPWFLLGGLAVAVPLVLHLIRHQQRDRIPFSSLMFLKASPPPVQRKRRLENWPLLLLRCLIFLLLALAFARPYLSDPPPSSAKGGAGHRILFLIDTSASMRRGNLFGQAKSKISAALQKMSSADTAALAVFDRDLRIRQAWTGDTAVLKNALAGIEPTFEATRLGDALIRSAEFAMQGDATNDLAETTVQVISDFQQGVRLDGLQGYAWPRQIRFQLQTVSDRAADNAHWTIQPPSDHGTNRLPTLRLANELGGSASSFQVRWEKQGRPVGQQLGVTVPAGQAKAVAIPQDLAPDTAFLSGDAVAFDNTFFLTPLRPRLAKVAYFGITNASDSAGLYYFFERALSPTPRLEVEIHSGAEWTPSNRTQWIVVAAGLTALEAKAVSQRVREGAHLLWVATDAAQLKGLEGVLESAPFPDTTSTPAGDSTMGQVDFDHPLLAMFRDARFNDFTRIHFWKHLRLTLPAAGDPRVLIRFDDGSPALTEWRVGLGRVSVLASDWAPAHSQLALSSKFVPLLFSMIEIALDSDPDRAALPSQATLGEMVPVPLAVQRVMGPGGVDLPVSSGRHFQPSMPGIYQCLDASNSVLGECAVNIDVAESRLATLTSNTWTSLRLPTVESGGMIAQAEQRRLQRESAVAQEQRQHWWQMLLLVALAVGVAESVWAAFAQSKSLEKPLVTV